MTFVFDQPGTWNRIDDKQGRYPLLKRRRETRHAGVCPSPFSESGRTQRSNRDWFVQSLFNYTLFFNRRFIGPKHLRESVISNTKSDDLGIQRGFLFGYTK